MAKRVRKRFTKAEAEHRERVRELGCLICRMPPELHHIRDGQGASQKAEEFEVLPLCAIHHRTGYPGKNPFGVAFHAGTREWQKRFGYERDLLKQVMERIYGTGSIFPNSDNNGDS